MPDYVKTTLKKIKRSFAHEIKHASYMITSRNFACVVGSFPQPFARHD